MCVCVFDSERRRVIAILKNPKTYLGCVRFVSFSNFDKLRNIIFYFSSKFMLNLCH